MMYFLIKVDLDINGIPKSPVEGNTLCWFGNLEYVTKDLSNPSEKLLQNYDKRKKIYGKQNVAKKVGDRAIKEWCDIVGIERKESINNMWARKTFITTGLRDLQLPAQQVMEVSGHKSERQMRKDYHMHMF